jgi:hypothetical protein
MVYAPQFSSRFVFCSFLFLNGVVPFVGVC